MASQSQTSAISRSSYDAILKNVGVLSSSDVQAMSGYRYTSADDNIEHSVIEITLNNGSKYILKLVRLVKLQDQPYQFVSLVSSNSSYKRLSFNEDPHTSSDLLSAIQSLNLAVGSIDTSSFRVQSESVNRNIYRITFSALVENYPQLMEVIYDQAKRNVISFRLVN